ncbi:MAG: hypothetical protein V7746_06935 [Halioglobus sp.]
MKIVFYGLLLLPALAVADEQPINWVDNSHAYATDSAQSLTLWMDDFFGDPSYDIERAESFLRVEFINDWDKEDGNDFKARLRGQVQLPKISQRVHLVFADSDGGDLDEDEREEEDRIALNYTVTDSEITRLDATLGYSSSHLKPGIRFRAEDSFSNLYSYRFTQRVQYEDGEGFYGTSLADLNRAVGEDAAWRWSNRLVYGEKTDGAEWRTKFAFRQRFREETNRPIGMSYFATINGVTRPDAFSKNYKLGVIFRQPIYRDYLFLELEPAYNFRRRELEYDRDGVWSLVMRLEIALEKDFRRGISREEDET